MGDGLRTNGTCWTELAKRERDKQKAVQKTNKNHKDDLIVMTVNNSKNPDLAQSTDTKNNTKEKGENGVETEIDVQDEDRNEEKAKAYDRKPMSKEILKRKLKINQEINSKPRGS